MRYICTSIVAMLILAGTSFAATINVPGEYATIQEAVDAASDGDAIEVGPGTYTSSSSVVVSCYDKSITLSSTDGPLVTIIDGEDARRGVVLNGQQSDVIVEGFTVQNCYTGGGGGGVLLGDGVTATLRDMRIRSNVADAEGGGLNSGGAGVVSIEGSVFEGNSASGNGGGLHHHGDSALVLADCQFLNNSSGGPGFQTGAGGGVDFRGTSLSCSNSTFISNSGVWGGGLYAESASVTVQSCEFTSCTVEKAGGGSQGGAIATHDVNLTVGDSIFTGNTSGDIGGAIAMANGLLHVEDSEFLQNTAQAYGGAIEMHGTSAGTQQFISSVFTENSSVLSGGALMIDEIGGDATVYNCEFVANTSDASGGGMSITGTNSHIENSRLSGNTANAGGGAYLGGGSVVIINSVLNGNSAQSTGGGAHIQWAAGGSSVSGSFIEGNMSGDGGGLYLGSSDIGIGSTAFCGNSPTHIAGNGSWGWNDQGGVSFEEACGPDCNGNGISDAIDIQNGTSADCNTNGVPDECDIAGGTSADCNTNGVPDECDLADGTSSDCNTNGVPDECDIAGGTSSDCNANSIPDECESLADCDGDGISDVCEILSGALDVNPADGVPDECQGLPSGACCVAGVCIQTTANGCFGAEGSYAGDGLDCADAGCAGDCPADVYPDGVVDVNDLLILLSEFGSVCP